MMRTQRPWLSDRNFGIKLRTNGLEHQRQSWGSAKLYLNKLYLKKQSQPVDEPARYGLQNDKAYHF